MPFFGLNTRHYRPPVIPVTHHMVYPNVHVMFRMIRNLQSQVRDLQSETHDLQSETHDLQSETLNLQSDTQDLQLQAQSTEKFIVTAGDHIEKVDGHIEKVDGHIEKVVKTNVLDTFRGNPSLPQITASDGSVRVGHITADFVEPKNGKNITMGSLGNGGLAVASLANGVITTTFTGTKNVAIGHIAHGKATTGSKNCVIGHNGAFENITGSSNTVIGYGALWDNIDGSNNTAIGASAGNNTIGSNNTFLGVKAGRINGLKPEEYLKHNYTTCLGVGSFASGDNQIVLGRPHVDIVIGGNYYNCADERDMSLIKSEDGSEMLGLDFISKLNPITYTYKNIDAGAADDGPVHYGLIAQDVKTALGSTDAAIVNMSKDHQLLCYSELIAPMIKSIQDLNTKISGFETKISGFETTISALNEEISALKV